jgi:hypothetical protein
MPIHLGPPRLAALLVGDEGGTMTEFTTPSLRAVFGHRGG